MWLHSTFSQFSPQLNLASLHQDETERKQRERGDKRTRREGERGNEQSGEAFFELSIGQSDQEGAIECVRVWERKKEGNGDRGGEGEEEEEQVGWLCTIGLDMNAPQHSFPHIPFNFNSLIELVTLRTHSQCAQRKKESSCARTHTRRITETHNCLWTRANNTHTHTLVQAVQTHTQNADSQ